MSPDRRPHPSPSTSRRSVARRVATLAVGALALAPALAACSNGEASGRADVVASAQALSAANGSAVTVDAFAAATTNPGVTVLDVRTPAEFASGHLPGAVELDVSAPDFASRVGALDHAAPYAVYCRSGHRSAVAVQQMTAAGFTDVVHLEGGIAAWQAAGRDVVTG